MLASCPASMLNQIIADLGIQRLLQISSRSSTLRSGLRRPKPLWVVSALRRLRPA